MTQTHPSSTGALWARFRFSVVGSLLSSPPARGSLQTRDPLSCREDLVASRDRARCPRRGRHHRALVLHGAPPADDPVGALRRAVRKDCGKISLAAALAERLHLQYRDHPDWSYQLHYDNLAALVKADPSLGRLPSYSTVKRYMQAHGLVQKPRVPSHARPGEARAERRRQTREIRSYEATHVGALWHLDFHHGSTQGAHSRRPVATPHRAGHPRRPLATVLPRPVVSLGDRRGSGARTLPGDPETGSAACPLDR